MGGCTCSGDIKPTPTNYGGTLKFIWSDDAGRKYIWRGPSRYCNPYNCSNKGCRTKGCAQARAGYCATHGTYCAAYDKKICGRCPNSPSNCANTLWEAGVFSLPLCADAKGGSSGGSSGGSTSGGSGSGDPYCKTNCDALPILGNLGCRFTKATKGCGGGWGGPPLEGNPLTNLGIPAWAIFAGAAIILYIIVKKA